MSSKPTVPFFGLIAAAVLSLPGHSRAQAMHYAGKVVDDAGKGISGALVVLEGSLFSAQTNAEGAFDLNGTLSGVRPGHPDRNQVRTPDAASAQETFRRADGRLQARGVFAYGILLSRPGAGSVTSMIPMAKRAATPPAAAEAPPAAAEAPPTAAEAAYYLAVTRAGYLSGRFSQSKVSALTLSLVLLKAPDTAGGFQVEKKLCLDEINRYRATLGLKALAWSAALEAYADEGARYDAARDKAHAHFGAVDPNPADAENEIPGWPLKDYKTVSAVMVQGSKMMWDEGPGGGHYENIKGSHTTVGCGIHITAAGDVWIIQDFR